MLTLWHHNSMYALVTCIPWWPPPQTPIIYDYPFIFYVWHSPSDLDIQTWRRYGQYLPPYQKLGFSINSFKVTARIQRRTNTHTDTDTTKTLPYPSTREVIIQSDKVYNIIKKYGLKGHHLSWVTKPSVLRKYCPIPDVQCNDSTNKRLSSWHMTRNNKHNVIVSTILPFLLKKTFVFA